MRVDCDVVVMTNKTSKRDSKSDVKETNWWGRRPYAGMQSGTGHFSTVHYNRSTQAIWWEALIRLRGMYDTVQHAQIPTYSTNEKRHDS